MPKLRDHINKSSKFIPYFTENTLYGLYKDKLGNDVQINTSMYIAIFVKNT